jgi:polysaccharide deacetylase family protein (PEP-CTERM system associated)
MNEPAEIVNALTVDVEDYFHALNLAPYIARETWETLPPTCPDATRRLLALFAEHNVRATFFVLGWIAQRWPQLVREIAEAGHEVACHGFAHRSLLQMTPAEFRADLHAAKDAIANAGGGRPAGFRAPSFSINHSNLWVFDVLIEEGFRYDSSLFPGRKVPVGFLGADRRPTVIERPGVGALLELPLTRLDVAGRSLPFAGGGYFRMYPYWLIRAGLRRVHAQSAAPAVIYVHPWEFAPDQRRIDARLGARLKHYIGLRTFEKKLRRLLADFRFARAVDLLPVAPAPPPI